MAGKVGKPPRPVEDIFKSLPSDWESVIINNMSQGASLTEVKAKLGLYNNSHTKLMDNVPEYKEAIKKGVASSEAWWQEQGRKNLENKSFSAVLWYMNMKNRFGWKDRQDITSDNKQLPTPIIKLDK